MTRAFLFIMLLACSAAATAQTLLTLEQVQQRALEHNRDLRIATLALDQAALGDNVVRAQRLPRLDLSAGYTHISEVGGIDIAIPGLPPRSISFGDGNIYESALTLSMPLFTGFRLSALQDIQDTQHSIAADALEGTRTRILHRTALMFRGAQLARRSARIYDEQLQYLQKQLATVKSLHALGQVLKYDVLMLSTRQAALRIERASAEAQYRNARIQLATMIDLDAESFDIDDRIGMAHETIMEGGITSLLARADAQRKDISILRHQQDAQALRVQAEKASYLPSVNAFASLRYGKPGVDQVSNEWMDYYTAGVALKWNLWSWGGDRARVEQQQIAVRSLQEQEAKLKDDVEEHLRTLINELNVLVETRSLLHAQITQETAKQNMLRARLEQGLATATEVVDAETALTNARLRQEQNAIAYTMKLTEIAAAIGQN